jgi:hypothetical protein
MKRRAEWEKKMDDSTSGGPRYFRRRELHPVVLAGAFTGLEEGRIEP